MLIFEQFLKVSSQHINADGKVKTLTPEAIEEISRAIPIVLEPSGHLRDQEVPNHDQSIPLDLPFKECFFEFLGGSYVTSAVSSNGRRISTLGIYVAEKGPRAYEILQLIETYKEGVSYMTVLFTNDRATQTHLVNVIAEMLRRIKTQEVGFCNPRTFLKLKVSGQKIQTRVSKVVYVSSKKKISQVNRAVGREIDWSHRWQVRGHWRSIPGRIGKDRDGNPQKDFTWVTNYVKGPENAPLVNKIRLVRSEEKTPAPPHLK